MRDAVRISEFDVSADAALAFAGDEALGGVALLRGGALGFVSPSAEGRGAGSRLLAWVEQRAIEGRRGCHRQRVGGANNSAHVLLDRHGYTQVREVRHISIELARTVEAPAPPDEVALDSLEVSRDAGALHEADARMFAGNADYQPESYETFCDEHLAGDGLAPELSSVARSGGRVVGFTLCRATGSGVGVVDLLAVDPALRRQGLGRALLLGALRRFAGAGLTEGRLDVAADNPPALALYASVGMSVAQRSHVFEKPLSRD